MEEDEINGERPKYEVLIKKSSIDNGKLYSSVHNESGEGDGLRMSLEEMEKKFHQFEGYKKGLPASIDENLKFKMFLEH